MITITPQLSIPQAELSFVTSRSSGPGGQNVNKVNSRVSLSFSVATSPSLNSFQKARIFEKLKTRITKEGVLQLHAQASRSQMANREALIERFTRLLGEALTIPKSRKKHGIPKRVREQRLEEKKQRGNLKKRRATPRGMEE